VADGFLPAAGGEKPGFAPLKMSSYTSSSVLKNGGHFISRPPQAGGKWGTPAFRNTGFCDASIFL